MKSVLFFFLLLPFLGMAQNTLSVAVNKVGCNSGEVSVAVYTEADGFLKFEKVYRNNSVQATKGITEVTIKDLPNGMYAVAVFHDKNGNGQLDTNWLGIPKEDVGFSKAKMKMFGPPSFKECCFELNSDTKIQVYL
ncbi:DUF2141 domain-containing protein [Flavobacteriaceae bacterium 3-367]|uniref:DUF2141 domain-containing protein n=1 Tax=Eudoraea algarum TaxID=3417568 RepID=UPI00327D32F3